MDATNDVLDENRHLRRTVRDLVALSTLPAVWQGLGYEGVGRSLGDALLNTLSLDFIYIRFTGTSGKEPVEVLRSGATLDEAQKAAVKASLAPLLNVDRREHPATIATEAFGTLRTAVIRFGIGIDHGLLIAASRNATFPTEEERLLLGVGANQTAIVVQRQHSEEQVHEQREWLRVTLASIGDAVIATDIQGRVTFLNSGAEELTGWSMAEAEGKPLETVFVILNQQTRQPVESPVEKVLREGNVVGLANHTILIARDGTERPIDDSAAPIRNSRGELIGVVMTFRCVAEQRRAEQHRNTRLAVTQVLNQATSVQDATVGVLRAVCENLDWEAGLYWRVEEEGNRLVCGATWFRPDQAIAEFETESRNRTFAPGEGLPGRVWAGGTPLWIEDVPSESNFPRRASAAQVQFAQRTGLSRDCRGADAWRHRVFHPADSGNKSRPSRTDGNGGWKSRPVYRAESRGGNAPPERGGTR